MPLALTVLFALPFYLTRSSMPAWQALIIGFLLFNLVAIGGAMALILLSWIADEAAAGGPAADHA